MTKPQWKWTFSPTVTNPINSKEKYQLHYFYQIDLTFDGVFPMSCLSWMIFKLVKLLISTWVIFPVNKVQFLAPNLGTCTGPDYVMIRRTKIQFRNFDQRDKKTWNLIIARNTRSREEDASQTTIIVALTLWKMWQYFSSFFIIRSRKYSSS